jgi:hypothetical protein
MAVDEIRPGMRGVGRSVFTGNAVDTFSVEILGVLPTAFPGGDVIIARLSGQGLEQSGIVAGMSGSPVFLDGRLIGAVALGWPFSVEPITGITPIAEMLEVAERAGGGDGSGPLVPVPPGSGMDPQGWQALWTADGEAVFDLLLDFPEVELASLTPLETPMTLGGFGNEAAGLVESWLEGTRFLPVLGGAAGLDRAAEFPAGDVLEPGSAVGVELVRGDAHVAAVGTVTWVDGDRVYAFGHPVLSRGASAYPLSAARILSVLPRASSSFKLGVVGPEIGAVTHDYRPGVVGLLGPTVPMIPMTLDVTHGDRRRSLRFEILDADGLTAALAGALSINALDALGRQSGAGTLRIEAAVALADGRRVEQETLVAGFSPPTALAGIVARLVGIIHGNPAERVALASVDVRVSVDETIRASFLDRIEVDPGPHRAGEPIPIRVWLRDYRGREHLHSTSIDVPAETPAGTYDLLVCDGAGALRFAQSRAPGMFLSDDLDHILNRLAQEPPFDALVSRLVGESPNPVISGRELPGLPASLKPLVATKLTSGRASAAQNTVHAERIERLDRFLLGCRNVPVEVER